ncbi:hypothetical protein HDU98_007264 [Podochytrium sp. JEL0797]|nr:hypothetical protein HDU98_007264 [Podochytrium sp. JEL0797]
MSLPKGSPECFAAAAAYDDLKQQNRGMPSCTQPFMDAMYTYQQYCMGSNYQFSTGNSLFSDPSSFQSYCASLLQNPVVLTIPTQVSPVVVAATSFAVVVQSPAATADALPNVPSLVTQLGVPAPISTGGSDSHSNVGAIVGGVVGALVVVAAVAGFIWWKKREAAEVDDTFPGPFPTKNLPPETTADRSLTEPTYFAPVAPLQNHTTVHIVQTPEFCDMSLILLPDGKVKVPLDPNSPKFFKIQKSHESGAATAKLLESAKSVFEHSGNKLPSLSVFVTRLPDGRIEVPVAPMGSFAILEADCTVLDIYNAQRVAKERAGRTVAA